MIFFKGIKFNRQELAGSVGDIGTDFPLIVAMIIAAGLHTPSVLIVFGMMQIITGLIYRMPMPVQPLKAMATLVIAQQIGGNILLGAGLSIGIIMFLLSVTGFLTKISEVVPKAVTRGIQLGLGINLSLLAFQKYIPNLGINGFILALISFIIIIAFIDNKKYPASIIVLLLGALYILFFDNSSIIFRNALGFNLPKFSFPTIEDITKGFLLLALPQIPLSIGNSIIATKQVAQDLFPEKPPVTVKKIGLTYSLMNLFIPFFSGIPSCHGSGGMIGHYTFGGRTGGSVIIYGLFYVFIGLVFGNAFDSVVKIFPLPILGVILVFEGFSLMLLVRDLLNHQKDFVIAILVGIIAAGLPYGFVISIIIGTIVYYLPVELKTFVQIGNSKAVKTNSTVIK
ncbi:MAG: putative sulfate/molybdate transporter [Ignavibacterium album]|uniref:putative sulfate/molybdate transporter n=1 Tax=Ignavibacterium album TaxID=591197 RepID=UPI0026EEF33B|nr:putative sulfate/molybdate transporter [Ignavibacterium album]MCX8104617.1 putative sulfate/molybdate transporter [Ignavibacterium album]